MVAVPPYIPPWVFQPLVFLAIIVLALMAFFMGAETSAYTYNSGATPDEVARMVIETREIWPERVADIRQEHGEIQAGLIDYLGTAAINTMMEGYWFGMANPWIEGYAAALAIALPILFVAGVLYTSWTAIKRSFGWVF